jgi:phosphate:Na+ symporter
MSDNPFFTLLPPLLGGVGLFLIGMILMSDGLKAAAGSSLQHILKRFTGRVPTAFLSGVGLTALVQSSSATTVTTIGFVSAGLLTFTAAIAVIIGATVGTTSTGWIVALLGFRWSIGTIALPLIGVGALLRLMGTGRQAAAGTALAGFGLIFIGINYMQLAMADLALSLDFTGLAANTWPGRLGLVLIGVVMTVLVQSSSAAVAISLTALYSGAITLEQTAYLVIGQNLGTTVTAVLASIGATIPAKRTALAYILYKLILTIATLLVTPLLLPWLTGLVQDAGNGDPALVIAFYHTLFSLVGALLFLPFLLPFSQIVIWLVPERQDSLTKHLDKSLLGIPEVAVEAAGRTLRNIVRLTAVETDNLLHTQALTRENTEQLWAIQRALAETRSFLGKIRLAGHDSHVYEYRLALLHAIDHTYRLSEACLAFEEPFDELEVRQGVYKFLPELEAMIVWLAAEPSPEMGQKGQVLVRHLGKTSSKLAKMRRRQREQVLTNTAVGQIDPDIAQKQLVAMRWVDQVAYHVWRMGYHLTNLTNGLDTAVYPDHEEMREAEQHQPETSQ